MTVAAEVREIISSMQKGSKFTTPEIKKMLKKNKNPPYAKVAGAVNYMKDRGHLRQSKTWAEAVADGTGVVVYEVVLSNPIATPVKGAGLLGSKGIKRSSSLITVLNEINNKLDKIISAQ